MRRLTTVTVACLLCVSMRPNIGAYLQASEELEQTQPEAPRKQPVRVASSVLSELLVYRVEPAWPETDETSSEILLQVTLNESGEVWNARVIRAPRALQEAAIEAVKQWLYLPLILEGRPVPVIGTVRLYPFTTEDRSASAVKVEPIALLLRIDASGVVWDGEEELDQEAVIGKAKLADAVGPILLKKLRGASNQQLRALARLLISAGIRNIRIG